MQFLSKSQQDRDKLLLNFKLKDTVAKAVLKKNNTVRGISLLNFKTYMAYSNQVCVKLEEEQQTSMEQKKESRNRPPQICPINFWWRYKITSLKEDGPFQQMVLENWTSIGKYTKQTKYTYPPYTAI